MLNIIANANCFDYVKTIDDNIVDTLVTSPPYFNLRDYHVDGQLGLESTVADYINNLCLLFDLIKPKLKNTGTIWVNLGDKRSSDNMKDYPRKQLILLPYRFAIKMTDEHGWFLRSNIVWHKTNGMPNSVKDRPTDIHETVLFFSKRPNYYYDADAIRVPYADSTINRSKSKTSISSKYNETSMGGKAVQSLHLGKTFNINELGRNCNNVWHISTAQSKTKHTAPYPEKLVETCVLSASPVGGVVLDPFMGSGTTAVVAKKFNRNFLGCELNPDYVTIANDRISNVHKTLF